MQRQIQIDEYKTKVVKSETAILDWAANVHPGSPQPHHQKRRDHLSINTARAQQRVDESADTTSTSDASDSPVRPADSAADLTAHGYSTVFVHLPTTPSTPSPLLRAYDQKHRTPKLESYAAIPEKEKSRMPRLRSLNILRRPGAKGTPEDAPPVPTLPASTSASTSASKSKSSSKPSPSSSSSPSASKAAIAARKRSQYGAYASSKGVPPPLAAELALMQFADGGKLETHARRVMERQALLAAGSRAGALDLSSSAGKSSGRNKSDRDVGRDVGYSTSLAGMGVSDIYRDAQGGMWYDAAEEQEYAHLLGGRARDATVSPRWEAFEHGPGAQQEMDMDSASEDEEYGQLIAHGQMHRARRPSHASSETSEASLDARFLLPLPELEDPRAAPVDDRVLTSPRVVAPAAIVSATSSKEVGKALALPNRARRASRYLLEKAGEAREGFEAPPRASMSSSISPPMPSLRATPTGGSGSSASSTRERSRGPARRRPAGPGLEPSGSLPHVPVPQRSSEDDRRAFIEDSFAPAPAPAPRAHQSHHYHQQQPQVQQPQHYHQQQAQQHYAQPQPAYYAPPVPQAPVVDTAEVKGSKFKIRGFFGGNKSGKA